MPKNRESSDLNLLISGLQRAVTGETEADRLAGAAAVLAAMRPLLVPREGKGRVGRRPVHNRAWAENQLISMAADVDGLPDCQADIVERLQLRFEAAGKTAPGRSWAQEVVGRFLRRSRVLEAEARERFLRSPEISSAFGTAENYATFCAWRMRVEERWLSEKDLRRRYLTPADYVAEMIERTPWAGRESVS